MSCLVPLEPRNSLVYIFDLRSPSDLINSDTITNLSLNKINHQQNFDHREPTNRIKDLEKISEITRQSIKIQLLSKISKAPITKTSNPLVPYTGLPKLIAHLFPLPAELILNPPQMSSCRVIAGHLPPCYWKVKRTTKTFTCFGRFNWYTVESE